MDMANCAGQRIGSVGGRFSIEAEKHLHHVLHLFLRCPTSAHHRTLDFQGTVFSDDPLTMNSC
jgi:hypothetical protein